MLGAYYKYNNIINFILAVILCLFVEHVIKYDLTLVEILLILAQADVFSEIQVIKRKSNESMRVL